jgi:hypothetical protein
MPHQCVRCGKLYEDASINIIKGCNECGGKFFFFIKKESIKKAEEITQNLTTEDRKQIEEDIKTIIEQETEESPETAIFLDIENIRVPKPGRYELDLIDMFRGKPIVCKIGEGKYIIDIISAFKESKKTKPNNL